MKKFANVICILMVMAFAAGCTKSVGPNRKSDALKRAKEYVLGKYGEEFEDAGAKRCTISGEKLTYMSSYIITDEVAEDPYNVVVHYDEEGNFVDIGDDKESDKIRSAFERWAAIGGFEPETYILGNCIDGGGESTIDEPIYYYENKYDGDIEDFIKRYNGVIYISYNFEEDQANEEVVSKLNRLKDGCVPVIEVRTSVAKTYNMGLSVALPADNLCSITLRDGKVNVTRLKKKSKELKHGIIVSTYMDESYKNMILEAEKTYESQCLFIDKDNILLKKNDIYKDEKGKLMKRAYQVGSGFEGHIEIAFPRALYSENDIKVYSSEGVRITPGISNDRFYYDDDYFYYLVDAGYIISFIN